MAIIGKYQVVEQVGEGAMGVVYKALDPVLGRTVAIKVMSEGLAQDDLLRERFLREAQAAGSLQHPNLVTIYDFGETDGHLFIAMEFIEGADLEKLMQQQVPLELGIKLDVIIDVLNGLSFAHRRGIIHRDIKPANIRLDQEGRARIMDFGVAKMQKSNLTSTGVMMGTPNYMAPEQITGEKELTPAVDLWAVGAVLYELLTNKRPFEGDTMHRVLFRIVSDEPAGVLETAPELPPALDVVVKKALAKEPANRFKSATEMANALTAIRAKLGGSRMTKTMAARVSIADPVRISSDLNPRVGGPPPAGRPSPMLIGGGVVGLLAAVGLVAYFGSRAGRTSSATESAVASRPAPEAPAGTATPSTPPAPVQASQPQQLQNAPVPQPPAPPSRDVAATSRTPAAPPRTTPRRDAADSPRVAANPPAQVQSAPAATSQGPQAAAQTPPQTQTQAQTPPPSSPPSSPPQQVATPPASVVASPPPPTPAPVVENPRPAIEAALEEYERAIGTRQLAEMKRVYAAMNPQQQAGWEGLFSSTRSIKATLDISSLNVGAGSATARVTGSYEFVTRAGRTERQPAAFEAIFAKQGEAWVLQRIR